MDDSSIRAKIEQLVEEEQRLLGDGPDADEHQRLEQVKVELDQCWDLLRQRRAREEFGEDPDRVSARDEGTVEGYQQ
jgi:hypothetical protein